MPATNSTSERTFSLLKQIKTYLRPLWYIQGRLNHLMILSAYRNRIDKMDLRKVASIFVQKNDGRRNTFSKFEFCWCSIFKMVHSPFECFCKFMVEKKSKSKKKIGITKISKGPNFLKPPPPLPPPWWNYVATPLPCEHELDLNL